LLAIPKSSVLIGRVSSIACKSSAWWLAIAPRPSCCVMADKALRIDWNADSNDPDEIVLICTALVLVLGSATKAVAS